MAERQFRDKRLYDRGTRYIWARVKDENGLTVRVSTGKTDEKAASLWCDEFERRTSDPVYGKQQSTTLSAAIEDWYLELRRRKLSDATRLIAEEKVKQLLRKWSPGMPLTKVDSSLVLAYIDARENDGVVPLTIKKELGALKGILEWARFRGVYARPLETVFPPRYSGRHKPRTRWLTQDEADALLGHLKPARRAHVAFILATGARRGESFRAQREDVHLEGDAPWIYIRGTKTEFSASTVPITSISRPYLDIALQYGAQEGLLFKPWLKMVRDLDLACRAVGIAKCSANDLRRTFATWHRQAGVPAEYIAVLLRHTTDTLAQTTYGRVTGKDLSQVIQGILCARSVPS